MANKEKLLANAQKLLSKGQVSKAISEYKKLVDAFPRDVRNRQKLAELLSRDKRYEEALSEYESVAKHYTDTGFYLKSIAVFKQMQKIEPSRVDIYLRLAELNEKQGLIGNALTEYRNLVAFYEKDEMHQEAIGVLQKMSDLDPDNLNYAAKIAELYLAAGLREPALEKFLEILEPLVEKGEYAKLLKLYERFPDICPEEGRSRLPLAQALLHGGSPDKALQLLKSLLKHSPEDPEIIRCLTDAYVANQDFANARLTLEHLLKQSGENLDLLADYVRICIDAGEAERARDRLEGWKDAFFQAERGSDLLTFYKELQGLLPDDPIVSESLSVLYETAGEATGQDEQGLPAEISDETLEPAGSALSDDAISDAEVSAARGEAENLDLEESPLDVQEPGETLPPEKTAAVGIELDLDLDLGGPDVQLDDTNSTEDTPVAVDAGPPSDESVEDVEVEIELDLDLADMGDLELEFEDEIVEEASEGAVLADAPVDAEEDEGLSTETQGLSFDEEGPESSAEVQDDVAEAEASEPSEELEITPSSDVSLDTEVPAEVSTHEEVEALEEIEELEALEEIEEVEALEEIEELEALEEIEELEVLEEVAPLADERPSSLDFASTLNVDSELEEVEFYLQQGLFDDAERVVRTLMEYRPELPELKTKLDEIDQGRQEAELQSGEATFVDIMADLKDDDLLSATDFLDSFGDAQDEDLSQKLVSELDSADTESHFNLGIAYKEMGLYDEAIAEFEKAGADSARSLDCITLTGQCLMESGDTDAALAAFKGGLAHEGISAEGRMALNFELGLLHQSNGQLLEALECFQLVAETDSFFREVSELIKNLRRELDLDDDSDDDGGPQGNRDRVSYV